MEVFPTKIPDVFLLKPKVFEDDRGFFFESYHNKKLNNSLNKEIQFVQDNHSQSKKGVLRGLHYQIKQPQGKLVRVVIGEVFDVAVDLRKNSSYFGHWIGYYLSAENKQQLWIPAGFAHGFLVLSEYAEFLYKTTDYYVSEYERCICWDDPTLDIHWPLSEKPVVSVKDQAGQSFKEAELF
ncbi:dTDP-4-dehydrorhamnose 3,5-epimerase [Candidatus Nitrosacidococcus tergens]|uniref:dTDP-4-dehydrorhamnose 3,5-epimerase n=1 Tax=Candidatus Nitrosacidococcus tergens TaxID=553981 RepID=A0A7G1QAR5_9GAMM|nr:dTDP-4-dehydrorhamnose 3,5-epimerase [Candidatus Nitrosacidococcus tergens]CAB1276721.1 dTDP-4-deoxyrhamnose-3,5-epimerase [Candidatus Nitrosacidococcus tergens]